MFAADAAEAAVAPAAAGDVALLSPPAHSCPTEPERGYARNICSTANLDTRLAAKLDRDARVRTLEMQPHPRHEESGGVRGEWEEVEVIVFVCRVCRSCKIQRLYSPSLLHSHSRSL